MCVDVSAGRSPPNAWRDDVVPGMIGAIQTHGQLLHWHPHLHVLITCGAWTPEGEFQELSEFDLERLAGRRLRAVPGGEEDRTGSR